MPKYVFSPFPPFLRGIASASRDVGPTHRGPFPIASHSHCRTTDYIFFSPRALLLSSFWTSRGHRCRPFSPPVLAFNCYRAWGSAIPLLVDFSSSVAKSRSFRKSICAHEKVPMNSYEYGLGGTRTHETDLYKARG